MSLTEASCERLQPLFGVHGWAFPSGPLQLSSEFLTADCCRLLTGDDGLPPRLLLLILLVWQNVACEYTFDSKLGHKIHKEHPIWHHCHKEKHADNPSRTLAVWSRQTLPRSPVQLKATVLKAHVKTQDHCNTDMNSNLALAAWLATKRTRQTFQFPHIPCQRRHLLLDAPGARMDQNMYVSMTTRRVRSTRRINLRLQDRPRFELGNKQKSLWGKKIYPAVWWVLGLPLVAA